jgi:hypothetical protein
VYQYDLIAHLTIAAHQNLSNLGTKDYMADHFGLGLAMSPDLVVVGAPVEGCVYTYYRPQAIVLSPSNVNINNISFSQPSPTAGASQTVVSGSTLPSWWLIAVISGCCALLVLAPLVFWLIRHFHRKRVLNKLKKQLESTFNHAQ